MMELLSETYQVARKEYSCMASDFIREGNTNDLAELCNFTEKRQIVLARRDGWKIKKGNRYIKQSIKYEGSIYTFRAIPEMHKLCLKYRWYPEL